MKKAIIVCLLILSNQLCLAFIFLPDDTMAIRSVTITSNRPEIFSPARPTFEIDSAAISRNQYSSLGSLLRKESPVHIKSYGMAGSSTVSIRGLEPRHTQISWNGYNINSTSLGVSDLSLIPTYFLESISIMRGELSTACGTSSPGGVISMNVGTPGFKKDLKIDLYAFAGSYKNSGTGFTLIAANKFIESKSRFYFQSSKNDFSFYNTAVAGAPEQEMTNAELTNIGLTQDFSFKLSNTSYLSAGVWYQNTERGIPPLMTIPSSEAGQKDSLIRTYVRYQKHTGKSILTLGGAWFSEDQKYWDDATGLNTQYNVRNGYLNADLRYHISPAIVLNTGIMYNNCGASFDEYNGHQSRSITSLFAGSTFSPNKRTEFSISIRKEFGTIETPTILAHIESKYTVIADKLSVMVSGGNVFNAPTLNDLFWTPGGNPELESEKGYGAELGLILGNGIKLPNLQISYYINKIDNWIKWYPGPNGYYEAANIKQVNAHGLEVTGSYSRVISHYQLNGRIWYNWCRSVTSKTDEPYSSSSIDKQLIYIPEHSGGMQLSISVSGFTFAYNQSYTGYQYVKSDNTQWLDPYLIGSFNIQKTFTINNFHISVFGDVNNLFDETYQIIAWRPMPGRWYLAGIRLSI